jgi:hypothetical protein
MHFFISYMCISCCPFKRINGIDHTVHVDKCLHLKLVYVVFAFLLERAQRMLQRGKEKGNDQQLPRKGLQYHSLLSLKYAKITDLMEQSACLEEN